MTPEDKAHQSVDHFLGLFYKAANEDDDSKLFDSSSGEPWSITWRCVWCNTKRTLYDEFNTRQVRSICTKNTTRHRVHEYKQHTLIKLFPLKHPDVKLLGSFKIKEYQTLAQLLQEPVLFGTEEEQSLARTRECDIAQLYWNEIHPYSRPPCRWSRFADPLIAVPSSMDRFLQAEELRLFSEAHRLEYVSSTWTSRCDDKKPLEINFIPFVAVKYVNSIKWKTVF